MLAHGRDVQRPGQAQCPTERPTPLREVEAVQDGMQVRPAPGKETTGIRDQEMRPGAVSHPGITRTGVVSDRHDS